MNLLQEAIAKSQVREQSPIVIEPTYIQMDELEFNPLELFPEMEYTEDGIEFLKLFTHLGQWFKDKTNDAIDRINHMHFVDDKLLIVSNKFLSFTLNKKLDKIVDDKIGFNAPMGLKTYLSIYMNLFNKQLVDLQTIPRETLEPLYQWASKALSDVERDTHISQLEDVYVVNIKPMIDQAKKVFQADLPDEITNIRFSSLYRNPKEFMELSTSARQINRKLFNMTSTKVKGTGSFLNKTMAETLHDTTILLLNLSDKLNMLPRDHIAKKYRTEISNKLYDVARMIEYFSVVMYRLSVGVKAHMDNIEIVKSL